MNLPQTLIFTLAACVTLAAASRPVDNPLTWPAITRDHQPGTRWWWMGSAVDPADLTRELEAFHAAGLGTVEITPIYGARGYENRFIDYLNPAWMQLLNVATTEAQRLDMQVDMATGTGWCFGGPNVSDQDANALAVYRDDTVSSQPSGQKVKRPAPGGEGWMLNLLYPDAMTRYLQRFSHAFATYHGRMPHGQFHDSYEYQSDWAPDFLAQFERRRGYDLQAELPALFEGRGDSDHVARVRGDYCETVSDLVRESITRWTQWSHEHGFVSRNQAHGSPGNWIDLYAASDIPETEFDFHHPDILVCQFASSAAHLTGKRLTSSETGTWAAEHFTVTLGRLKDLCDGFFLGGVNRIMWHGTAYSPADAPWPGWCFYASTEMNPRNPIWHDVPALNTYLSRVQSLLQGGRPDNDVLVYWPIYDLWMAPKELTKGDLRPLLKVAGLDGFDQQVLGQTARQLSARGYAFDFVSDQLLQNAVAADGTIQLGDGRYRAVVVPSCAHLPLRTMRKLAALAQAGAAVVFGDRVPHDVPGLSDLDRRRAELRAFAAKFSPTPADQFDEVLARAGVRRERGLASHPGVRFVRRAIAADTVYFIANRGSQPVDQFVSLAESIRQAAILDPMSGRTGLAEVAGGAVRLQLDPGESLLLRTAQNRQPATAARWAYRRPEGVPIELTGTWHVKFIAGGPSLPAPFTTPQLASWTEFGGPETKSFAGTALYTLRFDAPAGLAAQHWALQLGKVTQSARVRLNGRELGTVFAEPFRLQADALKPKDNLLEIEVTSTAANRIRDLDVRGVKWKIFYNINIVNKDYHRFDASKWPVAPQGLLGPVTLQAQASPDEH